jgi:hypothetical protein
MALADRAASALPFHEFEAARPRAAGRTSLKRGLLTLCAISCAMLVTGCARDSVQHEPNPPPPLHETKAAPVCVTPHVSRPQEQRRHAQPPIRRLDQALLTPQPIPDCEYKKADLKTVDPDEWARLKTEYERKCYQDAEKAVRERLSLLQSSIQQAR